MWTKVYLSKIYANPVFLGGLFPNGKYVGMYVYVLMAANSPFEMFAANSPFEMFDVPIKVVPTK